MVGVGGGRGGGGGSNRAGCGSGESDLTPEVAAALAQRQAEALAALAALKSLFVAGYAFVSTSQEMMVRAMVGTLREDGDGGRRTTPCASLRRMAASTVRTLLVPARRGQAVRRCASRGRRPSVWRRWSWHSNAITAWRCNDVRMGNADSGKRFQQQNGCSAVRIGCGDRAGLAKGRWARQPSPYAQVPTVRR